jgi:hypothetical protein
VSPLAHPHPTPHTRTPCTLSAQIVVWGLKRMEWLGSSSREFWRNLLVHVQGLAADPSRRVVITGHGFAGSIGAIVGALSGQPALVLSGPGLGISRLRFGVSANDIEDVVTAVSPQGDIVAAVDLHLGWWSPPRRAPPLLLLSSHWTL